jgi:hypothetical protein
MWSVNGVRCSSIGTAVWASSTSDTIVEVFDNSGERVAPPTSLGPQVMVDGVTITADGTTAVTLVRNMAGVPASVLAIDLRDGTSTELDVLAERRGAGPYLPGAVVVGNLVVDAWPFRSAAASLLEGGDGAMDGPPRSAPVP